jgi:hypothetical protein
MKRMRLHACGPAQCPTVRETLGIGLGLGLGLGLGIGLGLGRVSSNDSHHPPLGNSTETVPSSMWTKTFGDWAFDDWDWTSRM